MSKKKKELYNIYYTGDVCGYPKTYEGTTNNFKKWLKDYNKDREKGNKFYEEDFQVELTWLWIY